MIDFNKVIINTISTKIFKQEQGSNYLPIVMRKEVLLLRCLLPLGYCDKKIYQKVFGFSFAHSPYYDSWRGIFSDIHASEREKNLAITKIKQDSKYLLRIAQQCQKDGDACLKFSQHIRHLELTHLDDTTIQQLAQELFENIIRVCAYLLLPLSLQNHLQQSIRDYINKRVSNQKKQNHYFETLTTPGIDNTDYFEQCEILKLAMLYKQSKRITPLIQKAITNYLNRFDVIGVKYGIGNLWQSKQIKERIKFLAKQNPGKKLAHMKLLHKLRAKNVNQTLTILKADKSFKALVADTRLYVYLRTYRTDMINCSFANAFPLFEEIARRINVTRPDILECTPIEILNFKIPTKSIIQKRSKNSIVRGVNGKAYLLTGSPAIKIMKDLRKPLNTIKINHQEITGTTAYPGIVKGRAKIVLDNLSLDKIDKGDILIASMTTPDYVPAMERAAAFITDEGGILCHAAIVAREMKKPCVIGTKNATSIFKDGMKILVDAGKGIIRIIS